MTQVAVDFGTSNTVLARFDETSGRAETIAIPGITRELRYRLNPDEAERTVHVIPTLIHYTDKEIFIGNQVLERGLVGHRETLRWLKRRIALGVSKRTKTALGHKSAAEAGQDFLRVLLSYVSEELSFDEDEFTFTVPVEAFEDFEDWLRRVAEALQIARVRIIDEATSCILGYQGAIKSEDRYVVFDFGCGTLDVSAVRVDPTIEEGRKAVQLGQAGRDLGGMDIDTWIFDDFCRRQQFDAGQRRKLEPRLMADSESVKIRLSDPEVNEVNLRLDDPHFGELTVIYRQSCESCQRRGNSAPTSEKGASCLGCLLVQRNFTREIRETVDRALENAAIKAGMRREDITRVVVTGGTSLVPGVRDYLEDDFEGRVSYESPFDAVVQGACQGLVAPILQHEYAIESFNSSTRDYEFKPLFRVGTSYPTPANAVRFWARGSYNGMTRIGIKIFEVSQMKRRSLEVSLVDWEGVLQDTSQVKTENHYVCLNRDNPTFIVADPAVDLERDHKRFLCSFAVDGNRRLLVTVEDQLSQQKILDEHPVVRL